MVDYFLAFHETKDSPKKIQKPVVDFLESWQAPQSASEKAFRCSWEEEEKNMPWPGLFLRYLKRWWTACRWGVRGWAINWLSLWTAKAISGRDNVRYNSRPISLQYCDMSVRTSPSVALRWARGSMGTVVGLQARKSMSSRSWSV